MARFVSNVFITTDTFYSLIQKTNILLHGMSTEFVTTSNTSFGANTNGNTNIIGYVSANVFSTPLLKGGPAGNTAAYSSLTIGVSSPSNSSNVVITGYTANVIANNVNILSNTYVAAANLYINTSITKIISNTVLGVSNTSNNIVLNSNTIGTHVRVTSNTVGIESDSLNVTSISEFVGNTTLKSNSSNTNVIVSANASDSSVQLLGNTISTTSNLLSFSANIITIAANLAVDNNTLYVDSSNNRVGIGTSTPENPLEVVYSGNGTGVAFVNETYSTTLNFTSSNSSTNDVNIFVSSNNSIKLSSNNNGGTGYVFLAANGNIGVSNNTPTALISLANTRVYSNGSVQTSGDLMCSGDLYANVMYLGGLTSNTATATISPIVPPNTSYSSANVESDTSVGLVPYLSFSTTTPRRIDVIKKDDYQAVKYTLQIQDDDLPDEVMMTEVSVIYGFGNAHSTTYGTIYSNSAFVDVTVEANATHISLMAAPTAAYLSYRSNSVNLQFRGIRQKCK